MKKPGFISLVSTWLFIVIFSFYSQIVRSLNLAKGGSISITPETTKEEYFRLALSLICLIGFIFIIYHVVNFYRCKIKSYKVLRVLLVIVIISQITNIVLTYISNNQISLLFIPSISVLINLYIMYFLFLPSTIQTYQEYADNVAISKRMIK